MRSAYVYFPVLSSYEKMNESISNISGDFIQMKLALSKMRDIGFKGVLLAPIFDAFEFMGISPYMPKSLGIETALISPHWIYDRYGIYLEDYKDSDPRVLNHTSIWEKRRYIRNLVAALKERTKNTELNAEYAIFKKTRYDSLIYAALINEFPRYLNHSRIERGKDAEYWHFHTLYATKLGEKFEGLYYSGALATWQEDFFTMPAVRAYYENKLKEEISLYMFQQFIAEKQFIEMLTEADNLGMTIVCDIPIGVAEDSAFVLEDRMENKNIYYLHDGFAEYTMGTYDSNWGIIAYKNNPQVIEHMLKRYEKLGNLGVKAFRIDAILQLVESWIIHREQPGNSGMVQRFDGHEFFRRLREMYPNALLVSEDLSSKEMPYEVRDIQRTFNVYGMGIFTYMEGNNFEMDLKRMNSKGINVIIHTTNHDTGSLVKYAEKNWKELSKKFSSFKNFAMDTIWRVCNCENEYVIINILDLMLSCESFQTDDSSRWTVRVDLSKMDDEMKTWFKNDALPLTGRS